MCGNLQSQEQGILIVLNLQNKTIRNLHKCQDDGIFIKL